MYCPKYYLIGFRQTFVLLGVLLYFSLIGCNFGATSKSNSNFVSNNTETLVSKCKYVKTKEKPTGKELQINTERISDNEFLVKIKNVSNHKVFLPYTPRKNNLASSVSLVAEQKKKNGKFITDFAGGDAAPGLHSIDPYKEIGFQYLKIEKGEYRLIIGYLNDEKLANLLNNPECFSKISDSDLELIADTGAQIISPILKINKNIRKKKL